MYEKNIDVHCLSYIMAKPGEISLERSKSQTDAAEHLMLFALDSGSGNIPPVECHESIHPLDERGTTVPTLVVPRIPHGISQHSPYGYRGHYDPYRYGPPQYGYEPPPSMYGPPQYSYGPPPSSGPHPYWYGPYWNNPMWTGQPFPHGNELPPRYGYQVPSSDPHSRGHDALIRSDPHSRGHDAPMTDPAADDSTNDDKSNKSSDEKVVRKKDGSLDKRYCRKSKFTVGQKVIVKYKENGKSNWYDATIESVNAKGELKVLFDIDGTWIEIPKNQVDHRVKPISQKESCTPIASSVSSSSAYISKSNGKKKQKISTTSTSSSSSENSVRRRSGSNPSSKFGPKHFFTGLGEFDPTTSRRRPEVGFYRSTSQNSQDPDGTDEE